MLQKFLYGDQVFFRAETTGTTGTTTVIMTQSTVLDPDSLDSRELADSSILDRQSRDLSMNIQDAKDLSGNIERPPMDMTTGQVWTSPNFQERAQDNAPSQVADTLVQIDPSDSMFYVSDYNLGDKRVLTFNGPTINGLSLTVEAFKNYSSAANDLTFDLFCTLRDKRSRRMYLNIQRLQNLAQKYVPVEGKASSNCSQRIK